MVNTADKVTEATHRIMAVLRVNEGRIPPETYTAIVVSITHLLKMVAETLEEAVIK